MKRDQPSTPIIRHESQIKGSRQDYIHSSQRVNGKKRRVATPRLGKARLALCFPQSRIYYAMPWRWFAVYPSHQT